MSQLLVTPAWPLVALVSAHVAGEEGENGTVPWERLRPGAVSLLRRQPRPRPLVRGLRWQCPWDGPKCRRRGSGAQLPWPARSSRAGLPGLLLRQLSGTSPPARADPAALFQRCPKACRKREVPRQLMPNPFSRRESTRCVVGARECGQGRGVPVPPGQGVTTDVTSLRAVRRAAEGPGVPSGGCVAASRQPVVVAANLLLFVRFGGGCFICFSGLLMLPKRLLVCFLPFKKE